jgi:hypothetical protein
MTSKRVDTIQAILAQGGASLHSLNAIYGDHGTLLAWAAAHNMVHLIQCLIQDSTGTVAIDGLSNDMTTALMCE